MEFSFNQIVLKTKNQELLSAQLSSLFDSEVTIGDYGVLLSQNGPLINIKEDKDLALGQNETTVFEYYISTREELSELLQKVEFFYYRHQEDFEGVLPPKIISHQGIDSFILYDIDGRLWRFINANQT